MTVPELFPLSRHERRQAAEAVADYRRLGVTDVQEIVKVNPLDLIVHQLCILEDRSADYARKLTTTDGWFRDAVMPTIAVPTQIVISPATNAVNVDLPHGEFSFSYDPCGGFGVREHARNVAACRIVDRDRIVLWAGYHRMFARWSSVSSSHGDPRFLVTLMEDRPEEVFSNGLDPKVTELVLGHRPPLFGTSSMIAYSQEFPAGSDEFNSKFGPPIWLLTLNDKLYLKNGACAISTPRLSFRWRIGKY